MARPKLDILMVEDSSFDLRWIAKELDEGRIDYAMHHAATLDDARRIYQKSGGRIDLVLLDLNLPDSLGIDTLRDMLDISGNIPILVLTGNDCNETAIAAANLGAQDYLVKDVKSGAILRKAILFAMSRQRLTDELRKNVEVLSRVNQLDPLTGIYNRRKFDEELAKSWDSFQSNGEVSTLLLIDLDHFHAANEKYGHLAGDAIIRSTAVTIASRLRKQDFVFRYGGEEFCVLLPKTNLRDGWRLAEKIRFCIAEDRMRFETHTIRVTASIGVASIESTHASSTDFFQVADQALYRAKSTSRNVVVTSESLQPLESLVSR